MKVTRLVFAWTLILCLSGLALAETVITKKVHTDAISIMGQNQPEKNETHVLWIGKSGCRVDTGETSIILLSAEKKMLVVNHQAKEFTPITLPIDFKKVFPPEIAAQMDQILQMAKYEAKVTPTGETQKIAGFNAQKYLIQIKSQMMNIDTEAWASTEPKIDFAALNSLLISLQSMQPGMDAIMNELSKVKGLQVKSATAVSMPMMGDARIKSSEELVSIEEKAAPAGFFAAPAGYKQNAFLNPGMGN